MASMAEVARLKEAGREVLSLNIGEPDFAPPAAAIEAAIHALRDGDTKYGPAQGLATLRAAIRDKLARDNGLDYRPEDILVASGAKQIIFAAAGATLDPGDEVIVPAPYWVSYPDIVTFFEGKPVLVPCQASAGFKLTPDQLSAHLTARTRWLFLNSPGNPSGAVYSAEELAALGAVLAEHPRVLVMSDEIYEPFTYGAHRFVSTGTACPALVPRLLTVNGFSKGYAMTGLRLGYGAGPRWLIDACTKLITQDTSCANSISQAAALAALSSPPDYLAGHLAEYESRGRRLAQAIDAIPGLSCAPPQGSFYLFPSVAGLLGKTAPDGTVITDDAAFVAYLIRHAGVVTIPGAAFGLSPYIRLSFATETSTLARAAEKIADAVRRLT